MLTVHIATADLPAAAATALFGQCGTQYARRDPLSREIWHDGLACAPSHLERWKTLWAHVWALCPACVAIHQQGA